MNNAPEDRFFMSEKIITCTFIFYVDVIKCAIISNGRMFESEAFLS